jgi:hypothetical protein
MLYHGLLDVRVSEVVRLVHGPYMRIRTHKPYTVHMHYLSPQVHCEDYGPIFYLLSCMRDRFTPLILILRRPDLQHMNDMTEARHACSYIQNQS